MEKLEQVYNSYKDKEPDWKFPICKLIFYRTYSRVKENGERESWSDVIYRVVKNLFTFLSKTHDIADFDTTPQEMYELFWHMCCLCGGRSLFASTEKIIQRSSYALNNCSAYSINSYLDNPSMFFHRVTDILMQGCGVGFDCEPIKIIPIFEPKMKMCLHVVVDSREGWCDSIRHLFDSYFKFGHRTIEFDYSNIRAKGTPLATFGGIACGYEVLENCHKRIRTLMSADSRLLYYLTSRLITDCNCAIASAIVAGNIRRSSLLSQFDFDNKDMVNIKNFDDPKNDYRSDLSWCSNNSVRISTDNIERYEDEVKDILKLTMKFSEPNFIITNNITSFGRMSDPPNDDDDNDEVMCNPCGEASNLRNAELCNLSEVFLDRCSSVDHFKKCLRYAFFYCKVVSMMPTFNKESDVIIREHRRVGVSLSSIHEFVCLYGIDRLKEYLDEGYKYLRCYDHLLSQKLHINKSIRITVIAPSGTKSNLLGIFGSSINRPLYRHFIRRVRIQSTDPLLTQYQAMGYPIEIDQCSQNTSIILFPMKTPEYLKLHDGNMFYDLNMQVLLQRYWADQSVSCSVPINPNLSLDEFYEIVKVYSKQLKTMCFMTKIEKTYPQAPIEPITEERYNDMLRRIKSIATHVPIGGTLEAYYGCTNEHCS